MATTAPAPAPLPNLTHMHHFRSSSDGRPHKLHKHRSHPHMAFPETEKAEEPRDDHSSQASSNEAKSERSRKDSMKHTVKKVKKYLSRRFSGHHPHQEGNYSVISGGLVGAQFAYAALGRPASTPNSPSGGHSEKDRYIALAEDQRRVTSEDNIPVSSNDNDPLPDGDRLNRLPLQPTDMDVQTPDHSLETNADNDTVHPSDPFDQSFDSIDSRGTASSFELPDIHIPVPDLPPLTSLPDAPAKIVEQEAQPETQEECPIPAVAVDGGDEMSTETSDGSLTILDSVESLRSLNDAPEPEPKLELELKPHTEAAPCPAVHVNGVNDSAEPIPFAPATSEVAETAQVPPELSHASSNNPIPDHTIRHVFSSEDIAQSSGTGEEPSLEEQEKSSTLPPTAYVPYDDNLSELSLDIFDVPYFKATVVALAASGLGVMLASGAYRLLRTL